MICRKDVADGKAFWSAVTADRIVLPNGAQYEPDGGSIKILENSDNVSHPSHYADGWSNGAEVIDLTEHLSFCAGNVVKYVCRAGRKDPDKHIEDLKKARWYLDREIARVEGD